MQAYENTPAIDLPDFIRQYEANRVEAMRTNDAELMGRLVAPGFIFVRENGQIIERKQYLEDLNSGAVHYGPDASFVYQHSY